MTKKNRKKYVRLTRAIRNRHPEWGDPEPLITSGRVAVDGIIVDNPRTNVPQTAAITLFQSPELRGSKKLRAALKALSVPIDGRVALDVGAAAGGFSLVLLEHGARRVYALDAGFGQLKGSLRLDPRIVNLERTNLGEVQPETFPEPLEVVTIDLSYLALHRAAPELVRVPIARGADLVALIKPQFELGLGQLPTTESEFRRAVDLAVAAFRAVGFDIVETRRSSVLGTHGAVEWFLHARYLC